jgi:hypothetical protein
MGEHASFLIFLPEVVKTPSGWVAKVRKEVVRISETKKGFFIKCDINLGDVMVDPKPTGDVAEQLARVAAIQSGWLLTDQEAATRSKAVADANNRSRKMK